MSLEDLIPLRHSYCQGIASSTQLNDVDEQRYSQTSLQSILLMGFCRATDFRSLKVTWTDIFPKSLRISFSLVLRKSLSSYRKKF